MYQQANKKRPLSITLYYVQLKRPAICIIYFSANITYTVINVAAPASGLSKKQKQPEEDIKEKIS